MGAGLYLFPSPERMEQPLESFQLNAFQDTDWSRPCGQQIITATNKGKTKPSVKTSKGEADVIKKLEAVLHSTKRIACHKQCGLCSSVFFRVAVAGKCKAKVKRVCR